MIRYYDRDGRPLKNFKAGKGIDKRVAETTLPDGKWISTVWLGLDHSFGDGPPLIFETMVFPSKGESGEIDCQRYSTEADAIAGHDAMVKRWTEGLEARDDRDF